MHDYYTNPYQVSIDDAKKRRPDAKEKFTYEKISEAVDRSPRTINNWIAGTQTPDEDDVFKMRRHLKQPLLPVGHLLYTSKIARMYIPPCEGKSLTEAYVKLLKEFNDVKEVMDDLTDMISDGKITEDEIPRRTANMTQLRELRDALFQMEYATAVESEAYED
jgi:hypothetical protein